MTRERMNAGAGLIRGEASYFPSSVHVYATTYPDRTKNAPTTTLTWDSRRNASWSFVQHAMKWPTAMYAMRKNRVESRAGMNARFFFAGGGGGEEALSGDDAEEALAGFASPSAAARTATRERPPTERREAGRRHPIEAAWKGDARAGGSEAARETAGARRAARSARARRRARRS